MSPDQATRRVAIIGNGLTGNLAAAYFKRRLPECEILVFGAPGQGRPLVGESTVEVTAYFLHGLGLGRHLEEEHFHKYGLTHYFKEAPDDRSCTRYVVHEAPGILRLPAYQLNRFVFDDHLRHRNRENGVVFVPQDVVRVAPGLGGELHRLELKGSDERRDAALEARWIVDASGRNRFLARQLGLARTAANQRSSFWLRLTDFDRGILESITAIKHRHHLFDSYFATHHFYGRGYWIWAIPLRSRTHQKLISIGITFRRDICPDDISSAEDFVGVLERDHPVLARFLLSGRVLDVNQYRNYFYEAERYYSEAGWFLLGDAAFPSDPINSAGLATVSHQIPQIAAMIEKGRRGELSPDYVNALNEHVSAQLSLQDNWSAWYGFMRQPMKLAWTIALANALYFHVVLPAYISGAFLDGRFARALARKLPRDGSARLKHLNPLTPQLEALQQVSATIPLQRKIPNMYSSIINWRVWRPDDGARSRHAARYFLLLVSLRFKLISILGVRPSSLRALAACAGDLARAAAVLLIPMSLFRSTPGGAMCSPWGTDGGFLEMPPARPSVSPNLLESFPPPIGDRNADLH